MSKVFYRAITYLTCALIATTIMCQSNYTTPCSQVSSTAKSYDDCRGYDNSTAETVCCYVTGTSNNTAESACLDVDILFAGKTITYSSSGVTGQLICQTVSSSTKRHLRTMILTVMIILMY